MENQYLYTRHPVIQLLAFALITLVSVLAVMLLSIGAGIVIFQVPINEWLTILGSLDPANVAILKFLQITQSLAMFIIPPIIFGWFMLKNPWVYLGIDKGPDKRQIIIVLMLAVSVLPVLNLLAILNQEMQLPAFLSGMEEWMQRTEEQAAKLTLAFLTVNTFPGYLVNVLMVALIPAFGEEFFFRGVLQKVLSRWFRNPHFAILFVAIIFSAFHMQFYGFLPRLALGLIFGYLFYWTGNIWYPVLAHFINNFMPVSLTYFFREQFDPAELEQVGTGPESIWWAIPGLLISTALVLYFYKNSKTSS